MLGHLRFALALLLVASITACGLSLGNKFAKTVVQAGATSPERDGVCENVLAAAEKDGFESTRSASACAIVHFPDGGINFRREGERQLRIEGYGSTTEAAERAREVGARLLTTAAAMPIAPGRELRLGIMVPTGDPSTRSLVTGIVEVASERAGKVGVVVVTPAEINALLTAQKQADLVGCEENVACVAEIAGAIGVDGVLTLSAGEIAGTYVIGLKIIELKSASVASRQTFRGSSSSDIISRTESAVARAVDEWRLSRAQRKSRR